MSDSISGALMNLFALIATVSGEASSIRGHKVVHSLLLRYLQKKEAADAFLDLFHKYIDFYVSDQNLQVADSGIQVSLVGKDNISRICKQIRKELNSNERIIVLLRLIEYILQDP